MREIQAISKLAHKNIVGYQGCWVEAEQPDTDRVAKILSRLHKHRQPSELTIEESVNDDPEFALQRELQDELQDKKQVYF